MRDVLAAVHAAADTAAAAIPCAADVFALSDLELLSLQREAATLRAASESLASLAASEVARRSSRALGHAGLAARSGFSDAARFIQEQTGASHDEARKLIESGELLAAAEAALPPAPVGPPGEGAPSAETALSPEERLAGLGLLAGSWDACIGVALRNGLVSHEQARAIRGGLRKPREDASTPRDGGRRPWRS